MEGKGRGTCGVNNLYQNYSQARQLVGKWDRRVFHAAKLEHKGLLNPLASHIQITHEFCQAEA